MNAACESWAVICYGIDTDPISFWDGKIGQTNKRFVQCICLYLWLVVILLFIIGLKPLINAWERLPILFSTFLELWPNVGHWTPYLLHAYFKQIQSKSQILFSKILFVVNLRISNLDLFENTCATNWGIIGIVFLNFQTLKGWDFPKMKLPFIILWTFKQNFLEK